MSATDSKSDALFWREFGIVLGLLFVFFVAMIVLARAVGGAALDRIANAEGDVLARIAPVAQVRVGDPAKTAAATPAAAPAAASSQSTTQVAAAAKSPEQVYNSACMACHTTGAANAPKLGDKAAWEPRVGQGFDGLVSSVINGKGAMPPKAGNPTLTKVDIEAGVKYILEKAGVSAGN